MIKTFLRPNFIRRFSHMHSKTIFPENNNKVIEDLIRQQNERLAEIRTELSYVGILLTCIMVTIAWKPMK